MYFDDHAFQRYNGGSGNYCDIETGDAYWISGLKQRGSNRHWAGRGKIMVDRRAVKEFLSMIGEDVLPPDQYDVIKIEDRFPVERVHNLLNDKR